ncbi:unnamed protein product [Arctogadus glacialis]
MQQRLKQTPSTYPCPPATTSALPFRVSQRQAVREDENMPGFIQRCWAPGETRDREDHFYGNPCPRATEGTGEDHART